MINSIVFNIEELECRLSVYVARWSRLCRVMVANSLAVAALFIPLEARSRKIAPEHPHLVLSCTTLARKSSHSLGSRSKIASAVLSVESR